MSTRIALFFEGELEQVAAPMDLYQNPVSLRVADFIGNPRINFIDARAKRMDNGMLCVESALGRMDIASQDLTDEVPMDACFDVVLGVRPEKITICREQSGNTIAASVYSVQPSGSETIIHLRLGDTVLLAKEMGIRGYAMDAHVYLAIDPAKINIFTKTSGRLIKCAVPD